MGRYPKREASERSYVDIFKFSDDEEQEEAMNDSSVTEKEEKEDDAEEMMKNEASEKIEEAVVSRKRTRSKKMMILDSSSDDEEEEDEVKKKKSGDKKKQDSDSETSIAATEVVPGEEEEDDSLTAADFLSDEDTGNRESKNAGFTPVRLEDDDDEEDELLSIPSQSLEEDSDSERTTFKGTSGSSNDPHAIFDKSAGATKEGNKSHSSGPSTTSSAATKKAQKPGIKTEKDSDSDAKFFETDDDAGSDSDFEPSKACDVSSSEDDDNSQPIPLPKSRRPSAAVKKEVEQSPPGIDMDQLDPDINTAPVYDPEAAKSNDWHGDVQRTVEMLDETLASMPMPGDVELEEVPPGLVTLYPHQKHALRWMSWREGQFPGGGILADEMGLGKTSEVIALIMKSNHQAKLSGVPQVTQEQARRLIPSGSTLVVAPLGCIQQWKREIETKGRYLKVLIYHGLRKPSSANEIKKYDVVISTYHTIAGEIPKPPAEGQFSRRCNSPLKRLYWARIVLDEAHVIRNPKTNAAQALVQLEALHRWCVTGTPVHNRPEDFFSMVKFLRLTPFDERPVWDQWIGLKQVKNDDWQGDAPAKRLQILGKALILRRTKDDVGLTGTGHMKQIPPKTVEIIKVELEEEERKVYDMLMDYARNILCQFLSQKEQRDHGLRMAGLIYAGNKLSQRREENPGVIKFSHITALLIRLRQMAVLPYLIHTMLKDEVIEFGAEFDEKRPEHLVSKLNPVFDEQHVSSKLKKILEDVGELREAGKREGKEMDKVIIVSSWTTTLDIIHGHLLRDGYECEFITGRENMEARMETMDRFNIMGRPPYVLLLSLMAGGVGLNLTGANNVFFVEPHWNPQHELQAQDRVHRFGQTKAVTIKRYIAEETIESRIMDLQEQKKELTDGLLKNTTARRGAGINLQEMKSLFDMGARHGPRPSTSGSSAAAEADKVKAKAGTSGEGRKSGGGGRGMWHRYHRYRDYSGSGYEADEGTEKDEETEEDEDEDY